MCECEEIMTAKEAADFLKIKLHSLYDLKNSGNLPYHRLGKKLIRFYKPELIEWLKSTKEVG